MRTVTLLGKLTMLIVAVGPPAAAAPAPGDEVVVQASGARFAIERILKADNLNVDALPAREVADTMADITRGHAPKEFWTAYQAHVRAWQDYARAKEQARGASATDIDRAPDGAAIAAARQRIDSTFDRVEEIARRHGARIPLGSTRVGG